MPLSTKFSLAMMIVAVICFLYGYISYQKYDWVIAKESADISQKGTHRFSFTSQRDAYYELVFEVERDLEAEALNCRPGVDVLDQNQCNGYFEKLLIDWSITQDGTEVASGKSNESSSGLWGSTVAKTLHRFATEQGKSYEVMAVIVEPDGSLAASQPAFKVSLDRTLHKNAFVIYSIAISIAYTIAGLAAIVWTGGFVYRWLN